MATPVLYVCHSGSTTKQDESQTQATKMFSASPFFCFVSVSVVAESDML